MNLEWFLFEFAGLFYVKASLLLMVGIAAALLFRNHSAVTRYWSWNLCLLLLIVLLPVSLLTPNWEFSVIAPPGYSKLPPIEEVRFAGSGIPARTISDLLQTDAFDTNHDLGFWELLWGGLMLCWVLGVVALLAKLIADLISLAITSRTGESIPDTLQPLVEKCRLRAGCRQQVKVRYSSRIGSPLIWGLLRPIVLLPASAKQWREERLEMVLLHELLHAARFDHTMMVASQLVRCLYWANPLAWIAVHRHSVERELSCDERVISCGNDRVAYAEELVAITRDLRREVRYASVAMTQQYGLKTRVKSILSDSLRLKLLNRVLAQALAAVALLVTLSLATARIVQQPDPDSTEALVATLFGSDISLADDAARFLGERGDPAATPYLTKIALESKSQHTRMQSLNALAKIGGDPALDGVVAATQHSDEWTRYTSIGALEKFDSDQAVSSYWAAWESDPSIYVRHRAYLALARHDRVGDPRPVLASLSDADAEVRLHAVKLSGQFCSSQAGRWWLEENDEFGSDYCSRVLLESLTDSEREVREAAIKALTLINDETARKGLEKNLPDLDEDLRQQARAALKSL
jgi:beta-lactamase regulating signal transducer with metallopeptidase domain